ncbi:lysosomal cholesterol signaling protein-like [Haemaphysalis longicornis]
MWHAHGVVERTGTQASAPCYPAIPHMAFYWTLVKCFAIVLLGFVFGKVKLVKGREVRALDLLASHVCLSALLFLNLSQLRLRAVEWRLVGAVLLGKVSLFIVVAAVTLALSPRRHQKGDLASAGLYAIFVTQVNHFGIAYPLVESVFSRSHPSFAGYIYLVAPLSLVLLNPVGLFLIEVQAFRSARRCVDCPASTTTPTPEQRTGSGLAKAALWAVLKVLGDAFAAPILFLLGYHIEQSFRSPSMREHLFPAVILAAVKSLALPLFLKVFVELAYRGRGSDGRERSNFAFLYGSAPTAPIVILYASQKALPTSTVAVSVGVCTLLSLPVMFASAGVISADDDVLRTVSMRLRLMPILACLAGLSFVASVFVMASLVLARRTKAFIGNVLLCLLACEVPKVVGVLLWLTAGTESPWSHHLAVFLVTCGQYASRAWTACAALCVFLLKHYKPSELITHARFMFFVAYGVPIILTATVMISGRILCRPQDADRVEEVPLFFNGQCEAVASIVLLSVCAALVAFCLLQHAYQVVLQSSLAKCYCCCSRSSLVFGRTADAATKTHCRCKHDASHNGQKPLEESPTSTSARVRFQLSPSGSVSWPGTEDDDPFLLERHSRPESDVPGITLLITILFVSILVGIFVSYGKLFVGVPSGVFRAFQLVDATLSFGQGILIFLACGMDGKLLSEAKARTLRLLRVDDKLTQGGQRTTRSVTPQDANQLTCTQFSCYHRQSYEDYLGQNETAAPSSLSRTPFHGHLLVDWLLDAGLVRNREEGVLYGRRLLDGGLLRPARSEERIEHFYDGPYNYVFSS